MSFGNVDIVNPIGFLTPFGPRKINEIPLDVVIRETAIDEVATTDHPIEIPSQTGVRRGFVTDHAFVLPTVYSMRGAVSDFAISWRLSEDRYGSSGPETRSNAAYRVLLEHIRSIEPFTLRTPYRRFENMLFSRMIVDKDASTNHAIVFDAEFHEIQVSTPALISLARAEEQLGDTQAKSQAVEPTRRGKVAPEVIEDGGSSSGFFKFLNLVFGGGA